MGLMIAFPLILGIDRYVCSWIAFVGFVAAWKWSLSYSYEAECAIRRLKRMKRKHSIASAMGKMAEREGNV